MKLAFESRHELAPRVWQFYFRTERPLQFEPGQYANVRLGVDIPRVFTLTSLPDESVISFVTKVDTAPSSYKQHLMQLQSGDPAELTEPMGDFILPKDPGTPLVFVAGGIGIASYVSMAQWLVRTGEQRPITGFYAVRSPQEIILQEALQPTFSPKVVVAPQRLTAQDIIKVSTPPSLIYLSGSQRFVENLRADLRTSGVENYRIIFEYYTGYVEL